MLRAENKAAEPQDNQHQQHRDHTAFVLAAVGNRRGDQPGDHFHGSQKAQQQACTLFAPALLDVVRRQPRQHTGVGRGAETEKDRQQPGAAIAEE